MPHSANGPRGAHQGLDDVPGLPAAAFRRRAASATGGRFLAPFFRSDDEEVERGSDGTTRFHDAQGRNAGRAEPGSPGVQRPSERLLR